jgi:hypothetical protein
MIEAILTNLYSVLSAILLACFGGYIVWRNNFKSRRAQACASFRAAVLAALEGLYPVPSKWPQDSVAIDPILREVFPRLQTAVANFRPFVPWWRRHHFDRAWFRYHCSTGRSVDAQVYHHYMPFSDQPDPKLSFHANVQRLLSFASEA